MPSAVEEFRIRIATRLHEVEAELDSLRSALEALDTEARAAAAAHAEAQAAAAQAEATAQPAASETPASTSGRRSPRGSGSARRGQGRGRGRGTSAAPAQDVRAAARLEELERVLAETGGPEAVALARATGIDPAEVLARIGELERAGRARG